MAGNCFATHGQFHIAAAGLLHGLLSAWLHFPAPGGKQTSKGAQQLQDSEIDLSHSSFSSQLTPRDICQSMKWFLGSKELTARELHSA